MNLIAMLDGIGLARLLGLDSTHPFAGLVALVHGLRRQLGRNVAVTRGLTPIGRSATVRLGVSPAAATGDGHRYLPDRRVPGGGGLRPSAVVARLCGALGGCRGLG